MNLTLEDQEFLRDLGVRLRASCGRGHKVDQVNVGFTVVACYSHRSITAIRFRLAPIHV